MIQSLVPRATVPDPVRCSCGRPYFPDGRWPSFLGGHICLTCWERESAASWWAESKPVTITEIWWGTGGHVYRSRLCNGQIMTIDEWEGWCFVRIQLAPEVIAVMGLLPWVK